jgi:hypothetical protein
MDPDPSIFTRLGERWGLVGSDMQVLIACERGGVLFAVPTRHGIVW